MPQTIRRSLTAAVLVALCMAMSACSAVSSPLDQAYYTGGDNFNYKGGYTRTIFSSSNF